MSMSLEGLTAGKVSGKERYLVADIWVQSKN